MALFLFIKAHYDGIIEPSKGGINWQAIQTEFVAGVDYAELSAKYNVKDATIRQRAKRGNWSQKRHETSQTVTELAIEAIIDDKATKLIELNNIDLSAAKSLRDKAEEMLIKAESPNELKALAGVYDLAQKISRLALGASTENSTVTTKELPVSVNEFV